MLIQIEITTVCNSKCFYCPNDQLENFHMSWQCFEEICNKVIYPSYFLLQGTGEPLLHPLFWKMVMYLKNKGHKVGIITNGSIAFESLPYFILDQIGFSLDTLCEITAKKTGRTSPNYTVSNILNIFPFILNKINIYSVNYGQDLQDLMKFSKQHNIPLIIQNLQPKTSYQAHYKMNNVLTYKTYKCSYLEEKMRYFFINGIEVPCCYMIYSKNVLEKKEIRTLLSKKIIPSCCEQCRELI